MTFVSFNSQIIFSSTKKVKLLTKTLIPILLRIGLYESIKPLKMIGGNTNNNKKKLLLS